MAAGNHLPRTLGRYPHARGKVGSCPITPSPFLLLARKRVTYIGPAASLHGSRGQASRSLSRGGGSICPQRAPWMVSIQLSRGPEIASCPDRPVDQKPVLGAAGSRPPCGRPGLPVAETWGRGPCATMRGPATFGHAASDPEGSRQRGHFRCCGRPLLTGRARPQPRRLPSPRGRSPPTPSPRSPLPHLTWPRGARFSKAPIPLAAPGRFGPRPSPRRGRPAASPAWRPRGSQSPTRRRSNVTRPALTVTPRANSARPRLPTPRATGGQNTARRQPPLPSAPSPTPAQFQLCSQTQAEVPRTRVLSALTSRERTDPTPSARREPNRCLRARCRRRRFYRRRCCTRVLVRRRRLPTDQPSSPVTVAQACYLSPPPSTPALRKRIDPPPAPPTLPPTHPMTRMREPAPHKSRARPTSRQCAGAPGTLSPSASTSLPVIDHKPYRTGLAPAQ